jgi:molecular chaperone GrpE
MDPEIHDAMLTKQDKSMEDNCILEVFESGYTFKEKVIRHAKVIVNKK